MWAYYGNSHLGYCLEYEPKDDSAWRLNQFRSGAARSALMPILYTETPFDGNEYLQKTMSEEAKSLEVEQIAFTLMAVLCLQKLRVWSHEKEWRVIVSVDGATGSLPSLESPLKLSAVHAGLCMPGGHVDEIKQHLSTTNIKFYRMGVHKDNLQICSSKDIPEGGLHFAPK